MGGSGDGGHAGKTLTVVGTWPGAASLACQMSLDSCGHTLSPAALIVIMDAEGDSTPNICARNTPR